MTKADCIVIGGGPAGMMAAISAGISGKRVILIERNSVLGKKLLLTGNGRCNLSHKVISEKDFVTNFGKNGDFLLSPFSIFGPLQTISFFKKQGLEVIVDENGRCFPKSNKAQTVLDILIKLLKENKVEVIFNSVVDDILLEQEMIKEVVLIDGRRLKCDNVIITTGGKSFPQTGSDGNFYIVIEKLGHSINSLYPGLSPLKSSDLSSLMGISLSNILVSLYRDKKILVKGKGDVLFTHFGITGPVILDMSNELGYDLKRGSVSICLDLFPAKSTEEVMKSLFEEGRNRVIKNALNNLLPERLVFFLLDRLLIDKEKKVNQIGKQEMGRIVAEMKSMSILIEGVMGFDQAMVTGGGVSLKEIDSKTMKSKLVKNLYFAGEVIDIIGKTGGYNLQACWSTGYVAGQLR